jgi:hypothetical protein
VAAGDAAAIVAARTDLHGILLPDVVAQDVREAARVAALAAVDTHHAASPGDVGPALPSVRAAVARSLRRVAAVTDEHAHSIAAALVDELVTDGLVVRDGDRIRTPGRTAPAVDPQVAGAMDRLEAALAVIAPPPLHEAAAAVGCPAPAIRELERLDRIVVLDEDLAYAMSMYRDLAARALALAARQPLTPAAFRDATGTSRRYVLPILEDLDRRGILRRTPDGHVPGPRAPVTARGEA